MQLVDGRTQPTSRTIARPGCLVLGRSPSSPYIARSFGHNFGPYSRVQGQTQGPLFQSKRQTKVPIKKKKICLDPMIHDLHDRVISNLGAFVGLDQLRRIGC